MDELYGSPPPSPVRKDKEEKELAPLPPPNDSVSIIGRGVLPDTPASPVSSIRLSQSSSAIPIPKGNYPNWTPKPAASSCSSSYGGSSYMPSSFMSSFVPSSPIHDEEEKAPPLKDKNWYLEKGPANLSDRILVQDLRIGDYRKGLETLKSLEAPPEEGWKLALYNIFLKGTWQARNTTFTKETLADEGLLEDSDIASLIGWGLLKESGEHYVLQYPMDENTQHLAEVLINGAVEKSQEAAEEADEAIPPPYLSRAQVLSKYLESPHIDDDDDEFYELADCLGDDVHPLDTISTAAKSLQVEWNTRYPARELSYAIAIQQILAACEAREHFDTEYTIEAPSAFLLAMVSMKLGCSFSAATTRLELKDNDLTAALGV